MMSRRPSNPKNNPTDHVCYMSLTFQNSFLTTYNLNQPRMYVKNTNFYVIKPLLWEKKNRSFFLFSNNNTFSNKATTQPSQNTNKTIATTTIH